MLIDSEKIISAIIILDPDYNILFFNEKASNITEYTFEEIKKANLEVLNSFFFENIYSALEKKNFSKIEDSLIINTKNSKEKHILRNIEFDEKNNIVKNIVISFIDVTYYKQIENTFFNFQKLESLGVITSAISIDYNNLLTAIYGFSSFLKTMINPKNEMYNYLDIIEKSATKASSLTNQLLSYAGNDYTKQVYVNLNKIISQHIELFKKTLNPKIKIISNLSINDIFIYWDENQINQIIINTIQNAKESIESKNIPGSIEITTFNKNGIIKYVIKDNGNGIKKEYFNKIFEPYFTTKDIKKHSGLGLSVTEGIVRNLGGKITFNSNEDYTEFEIELPYKEIDIENLKLSDLYGNNEKILVIDDMDVMRNLSSLLLKQKKYDPIVASSGKEGLEIIKKQKIDLVLLDIVMPEMSGEEVFFEIKKIDKNIPIIMLTGYSEEKLVKKLEKNGSDGFIVKPFETYDFFNKIHSVLNKKNSSSRA